MVGSSKVTVTVTVLAWRSFFVLSSFAIVLSIVRDAMAFFLLPQVFYR